MDKSIRCIITQWARVAEVDGRVSEHSLRVGSTQYLLSAVPSLAEMQSAELRPSC